MDTLHEAHTDRDSRFAQTVLRRFNTTRPYKANPSPLRQDSAVYASSEVTSTGDGMSGPASRSRSVVSIGRGSSAPAPGARTLEDGSDKLEEVRGRGTSGSLAGGCGGRDATGPLSTASSFDGASKVASVTVCAGGGVDVCSECVSSSSGPSSSSADSCGAGCDPPAVVLDVSRTLGGSSTLCECATKSEDRGSLFPVSSSTVERPSLSRARRCAERAVVTDVSSYSSSMGCVMGEDASDPSTGPPNPW